VKNRRDSGASLATVVILVALVVWIAAMVGIGFVVRETNEFGGITNVDEVDRATRDVFVLGGMTFFSILFGVAGWQINRPARVRSDLLRRLALVPLSDATLRDVTRSSTRIANLYVGLGAIVTVLGFAAAAFPDQQGPILWTMVTLCVLWAGFAGFAIVRSVGGANAIMGHLGLQVTGLPSFRYSFIAERGWMTGAMTYGGERHGRPVTITQHPLHAVTQVWNVVPRGIPTEPDQMATLTGLPSKEFRKVTVAGEDGQLFVYRSGNGAGRWMLHDLLLAEALAVDVPTTQRRPPPPPPPASYSGPIP
jgi:hypothetical protein